MLPTSPEVAFQSAANHAAAAYTARPAFVQYRVSTHITIPAFGRQRDYQSAAITRETDDRSIITDLVPQGGRHIESQSFPFAPPFDALADFQFSYGMNFHKIWFSVTSLIPRTYREAPAVQADITARGLRDYKVRFASDSSKAPDGVTHLLMTPYDWVRAQAPHSTYYFHEVWIDNQTQLPVRVDFDGTQNLGMSYRYGIVDHQWVVQKAHLEQDTAAPFHLGKVHFLADATFDQIRFSDQAPAGASEIALPRPAAATPPHLTAAAPTSAPAASPQPAVTSGASAVPATAAPGVAGK